MFGWESVETDRGFKRGYGGEMNWNSGDGGGGTAAAAGRASVRHRAHQFVPLLERGSARAGFAGKSCAELLRQDLCGLSLCAIKARAGYVRLLKTLYCSDVATPSLLAHSTSISLMVTTFHHRGSLPNILTLVCAGVSRGAR